MTTSQARNVPPLFYGYIIILVSAAIAMVVEGLFYSFGVFFEPLLLEFGWTRTMTSGAFSSFGIIRLPVIILSGRLTDRFGSRAVLSACGFFLALGYMLMSQINTPWQLYLFYGVLVGTGMGLYWVPLVAVVPRWFIRRRALALGIVISGIGVGQVIFPPLANWLIAAYGWRLAYLILGAVCMGIVIPCAQFLRQDPREKGLFPDGEHGEVRGTQTNAVGFSAGQAVRTRQFWLFCGMWFPWIFCLAVILVHVVIYATGTGMSPAGAAKIIAIIGIAGIAGRLLLGHLADIIGLRPVLILSLALSSAAFLWLLISPRGEWTMYLFAAMYGIAYGTFEVMQSPVMVQLFGLASFGTIFGIALAFSSLGFIIGPVIAGYIFDTTGSYQPVFLTSTVLSLISLGCAALLPLARQTQESRD